MTLRGWINRVSKHDIWDAPMYEFGRYQDGRVDLNLGQEEFAIRVTQEQAAELIEAWREFQSKLYAIVAKFDGKEPENG